MFDLSIGKLLVIGLLALFLVGPDKLPQYAARLAHWVRAARAMADGAKRRLASEMGPEFEDVDWASLDPRRYHPRRMIQDAWNRPLEAGEADAPVHAAAAAAASAAVRAEPEVDLLELAEARAQQDVAPLRHLERP